MTFTPPHPKIFMENNIRRFFSNSAVSEFCSGHFYQTCAVPQIIDLVLVLDPNLSSTRARISIDNFLTI